MGISAYELSVLAGKTAVVVIVLFALYRVLGKRNVGQFTVYDLVTIIAVANAVQNAMTAGRGELLVGIVSSSTLLLLAYGFTRLFALLPGSERMALGEPVLLVSQGRLLKNNLRRQDITLDELRTAFRQHGLLNPKEVEVAVLELDGTISIVPKDRDRKPD